MQNLLSQYREELISDGVPVGEDSLVKTDKAQSAKMDSSDIQVCETPPTRLLGSSSGDRSRVAVAV